MRGATSLIADDRQATTTGTSPIRVVQAGDLFSARIRQLGEELLRQFEAHPLRSNFPPFAGFRDVESKAFYGTGYQDVAHRKPSIENAKRLLNWEPTVEMSETIGNTLDFFLREAMLEIADKR